MKRLNKFNSFFPFLVVILFPILLFWELFLKGKVLFWGTTSLQFIPWLTIAWKNTLHGQIPLWNAFNGMGSPFIANYQSAYFYLPTWITFPFYNLGGVRALRWGLSFVVMCHIIWAGIGMVLLVRRLQLPPISQMISGLAFTGSSFLLARVNFISMVYAIAWFPWLVWAVELVISQKTKTTIWKKVVSSSPLVLIMTMQLLAGHAQITWYCILFTIIWVLLRSWKNKEFFRIVINLTIFACCGVIALLIASVQLLPTLELLINSQRASEVGFEYATNYSLWPWHLFTFLSPNIFGSPGNGTYWGYGSFWEDAIYIGLLPLLIALSTIKKIFHKLKHSRLIRYLWGVVIISILLSLGKNFPLFPFLYRFIPTFDLFQAPARYMVWAVFSLSILAGIGTSELNRFSGWGLYCLRLSVMASLAIIIAGVTTLFLVSGQVITIAFSVIMFGLLGVATSVIFLWRNNVSFSLQNAIILFLLFAALIGFDLFFANKPSIPLVATREETGILPADVKIDSNITRTYFDKKAIYNLYYSRFFRFDDFRFLENPSNLFSSELPNINLIKETPLVNNFDPLLPNRFVKWMAMLDDSNRESGDTLLALMNVGELFQFNPGIDRGYEELTIKNTERFHWFSCAYIVKDGEEAFETIQDWLQNDQKKLSEEIIIENPTIEKNNNCLAENNASILLLMDRNNEIEVKVENSVSGWLMVSDSYYPGWEARVDGIKTEISPAQYIFKAIPLQPGKHDIIFIYRPKIYLFGAIISSISLVSFICILVIARHFQRGSLV